MERARAALGIVLLILCACEPPRDARPPLLKPGGPAFSIPPNAAASRVKSVYDGDTVTLDDGRKVRLLAVDTPEIKEHEPFAIEARDLVRGLCEGRDVWLEFDAEREDRYGRLLCYLYVRDDAGPRMVNAEILRSGLGRFYTPGANSRYADALLTCQRDARDAGRGSWKDYVLAKPKKVVVTRSGHAYHRPECREIQDAKGTKTVDESEALDKGLSRCRTCKP
jgi:micrococcal nuclease